MVQRWGKLRLRRKRLWNFKRTPSWQCHGAGVWTWVHWTQGPVPSQGYWAYHTSSNPYKHDILTLGETWKCRMEAFNSGNSPWRNKGLFWFDYIGTSLSASPRVKRDLPFNAGDAGSDPGWELRLRSSPAPRPLSPMCRPTEPTCLVPATTEPCRELAHSNCRTTCHSEDPAQPENKETTIL